MVRRLADRLAELLRAEHGEDTAGRFTALEQMWRHDPLMREVALSPRLGAIAAAPASASDVRIYHDNALSKEPGCGRTPWHHDAEHFPLATLSAVTAWMPVSAIPVEMGPLSFARGADLRPLLDGLVFDRVGTSYDEAVSARFGAAGVARRGRPVRRRRRQLPRCALLPHRRAQRHYPATSRAGHDLLRRRRPGRRRADDDQRHLAGVPARRGAWRPGGDRAEPDRGQATPIGMSVENVGLGAR